MMDTFLNDPFFRDTEAITSSFLDSMIPKDTVSNMNQFDFLVDIVEKKDKFHLSGELPGCNVANVDVKFDKDNNLHISAMKSIKHEEDEQSPDGSVKWHAIETLSEQRRKRSTRRAFFVARISRFVDATIIRDRFCR